MVMVNTHDAKTHLSRLLRRVAQGEEIVIARDGLPLAKLVPMSGAVRVPGRLRGKIVVGDDFDLPLPGMLGAAFRGDEA